MKYRVRIDYFIVCRLGSFEQLLPRVNPSGDQGCIDLALSPQGQLEGESPGLVARWVARLRLVARWEAIIVDTLGVNGGHFSE